jgi:hypothetical protein
VYKIEITADTLAELAGKAMSLAVKLNSGAATEPAASKADFEQARRMVDEAFPFLREVADPAPEAPAPAAPAPEAPVAEAPALSFEKDVAPVVLRAVATKGKPYVEGIMTEFGVVRASQLDAARWAELIERLEADA